MSAVAILSLATVAMADDEHEEHYDIGIWNDGGVLVTGGWDHDHEELAVANLRVFEATFGEDPAFPFSTDEPGIGGVAADLDLPVGSMLQLNITAGLGAWNGNGFDNSTDLWVTADYGPLSASTVDGGPLEFLVTDDYDLHPTYTMNGEARNGAYLVEMYASMDGYQSSESFWVVFNLGLDEEEYETAVEWVENNLVPTPAALPLLTVLGLVARRRRRS